MWYYFTHYIFVLKSTLNTLNVINKLKQVENIQMSIFGPSI